MQCYHFRKLHPYIFDLEISPIYVCVQNLHKLVTKKLIGLCIRI